MSLHSSLKISLKARKQRSVLKRFERIKYAIRKGTFNEQDSVYGLPKIKSFKIKVVKKEKAEDKSGAAQGGAAKTAATPAAKAAKGTVQAKA